MSRKDYQTIAVGFAQSYLSIGTQNLNPMQNVLIAQGVDTALDSIIAVMQADNPAFSADIFRTTVAREFAAMERAA